MRAALLAAMLGRAAPIVPPTPAPSWITPESLRLVVDGNSFTTGVGAPGGSSAAPGGSGLATALRASAYGARFAGYTNIGISGQSWQQMLADKADLDAALALGPCVLVLVEGSNNVFNDGRTAAQTMEDLAAYTAYARSVQPAIKIVAMGTVPRYGHVSSTAQTVYGTGSAGIVAMNQAMADVNAAIEANPALYGVDLFVPVRGAGSPFAFSDWGNQAPYISSHAYYDDVTHPGSDIGVPYLVNAIVSAVSSVTSLAIGYNLSAPTYYSNRGFFANLLKGGLKLWDTGSSTQLLATAGGSGAALITDRADHDLNQWKPGNYAARWPVGVECRVTINGTTTSLGTSGYGTFTLPAMPAPSDALAGASDASGGVLSVAYFGANVDCSGASVYHVDDEAQILAGQPLAANVASALATSSVGPVRFLNMQNTNAAWIRAVDEIPSDDLWGSRRQSFTATYSGGVTVKFTGYNSGDGTSPELIGRIGSQVGRGIHLCMPPMMTDAALTAYFTRLSTTYPSGVLRIEASNEPFISPQFAGNAGYLGSGQYHIDNGLTDTSGIALGTDNDVRRAKAYAHCSLRCWKAAETVFGRSRVQRHIAPGNEQNGDLVAAFVDPGIIQSGATLGALLSRAAGDAITIPTYFGQVGDNAPNVVAPGHGAGAHQGSNSFHISARYMCKTRTWETWNTARHLAAIANSVDQNVAYVARMKAWAATAGVSARITSYEGLWPHWDDGRSVTDDVAGLCMSWNATTGELTPASATVNGIAFTDSGESVTDHFGDVDVVKNFWAGTDVGGVADGVTYLCKVVSGKLRLYASQAAYTAGTHVTGGANRSSLILWNVSRLNALLIFRANLLTSASGPAALEDFAARTKAAGLDEVCIFAFSGNANKSETNPNYATVRPWSVVLRGAWDTSGNQAVSWAKART
jgi:hypothetical protein